MIAKLLKTTEAGRCESGVHGRLRVKETIEKIDVRTSILIWNNSSLYEYTEIIVHIQEGTDYGIEQI